MNPTDKNQQIADNQAQQGGQSIAPHQPVTISGQPYVPTSHGGKELPHFAPQQEVMCPTEIEPFLHEEMKEAGVEVSKEQQPLQIPDEQKEVGIEVAKAEVPAPAPVAIAPGIAGFTVAQAAVDVKKTQWHDSVRWALTLFLKEQKKPQASGILSTNPA